MKKSVPFRKDLLNLLKDPGQACAYLNVALMEGDRRIFLEALHEVADAMGGMSILSRKTNLHRVNLYRILSKHGNPEIHSLENILKVFGLRLAVVEDKPSKLRKAA
jgi:probable addiction module antidote protein